MSDESSEAVNENQNRLGEADWRLKKNRSRNLLQK